MRITKSSAAEVASKLSPAARKLLFDMFVEKRKPVKVQADQFMAIIELIALKILRADVDWGGGFVTVLERGGKMVLDVLKAQAAREVKA